MDRGARLWTIMRQLNTEFGLGLRVIIRSSYIYVAQHRQPNPYSNFTEGFHGYKQAIEYYEQLLVDNRNKARAEAQ